MIPLLAPLVLSALTFTTHFPLTRGTPSYAVSGGVVYAVNRGVLYRSGDGGASFETRGDVGGAVVVDPDGIVYDVAGLRRSDDGGATWKRFGEGASGVRLAINPANPAEIRLFGVCSSFHPQNAGVFVSTDRGDTWQHETSDCTFDVTIDPLPPHATYRAGLFNSGAGLPTRQIVGNADVRYGLNTVDANVILASTDGVTWKPHAIGERVSQLALDGNRLVAARASGLYLSIDNAQSWQRIVDGPVTSVVIDGDRIYIAKPDGFFHAPLNTLAPFTPVSGLPLVPMAVNGLAGDPHATRLYATAEEGVWRSDDGGEHWDAINGDDTTRRGAIAVDGGGDVYAFDDTTVGIEQTADLFHYDGVRSEHFATGIQLPLGRTLWADPHRRGVLYTLKNALLYTSHDGGHAWTLVASLNDGTKWIAILSVSFGPDDSVYATTDAGIYRSLDGGATWSVSDQAIPFSDWMSRGRDLYHSTDGGRTWDLEATLPGTIRAIVVDAVRIHVAVDGAPGEYDALIRHERRRAAGR
ncbi:MAG TPA: hypothetical protein VJZ76_03880 [Thermoanaerobaculia bacterium]|nr:hypothetical protein [Thermoanaerobaculia bacterium]